MSSPELFDFYPYSRYIFLFSCLGLTNFQFLFLFSSWLPVWLSEGLKHSLPRQADSIDKQSGEKVMRGQFNTYRV